MKLDFSILDNPKFSAVVEHYRRACAASREHSAYAQFMLGSYGDHGAQISGCVRDHFPEAGKDRLRYLARQVANEMDLAKSFRPKYCQMKTIYHIGRLVATRDGVGFYGPATYPKEA